MIHIFFLKITKRRKKYSFILLYIIQRTMKGRVAWGGDCAPDANIPKYVWENALNKLFHLDVFYFVVRSLNSIRRIHQQLL